MAEDNKTLNTSEAVVEETVQTEVKKKKKGKKSVAHIRAVVNAGFNNTIVTIADEKGNTLAWASSGGSGFRGSKKSTPYAAQVAAENAMAKLSDVGIQTMEIIVKGLGPGRDQALRGLQMNNSVNIISITDKTSIPHGGCRQRKARRV